jgi:hypothetical protein
MVSVGVEGWAQTHHRSPGDSKRKIDLALVGVEMKKTGCR